MSGGSGGRPPGLAPSGRSGLALSRRRDGSVACSYNGTELFRYVYRPTEPEVESPRPFFHPIRTLGGDVISLYRPHDHVWHKGISWSLCEVGGMNFWGGPSFRRDRGYVQLDNNGTQRHDRFAEISVGGDAVAIDERLSWITPQGETWIAETRKITASVLPDREAWRLGFATTMRNVSGHVIPLGSATTQGRENAGYSGLFWRGPRSFSGGTALTEKGPGGDELMGIRAPWLGYTGRHDGTGRDSTLLFADNPQNYSYPSEWFVRTGVYACLCPAPFFTEEYQLQAGQDLTLAYDVIVADGALDDASCARLVADLRTGQGAGA
jgi:Methane oxygenase PmoA